MNGANGKDGAQGPAGSDVTTVPSDLDPTSASAVVTMGTYTGQVKNNCHHHCSCQVVCCTYYYNYMVERTDHSTGNRGGTGQDGTSGAPGTNGEKGQNGMRIKRRKRSMVPIVIAVFPSLTGGPGGNGGNGGRGGDSGNVQLTGNTNIKLNVQKIGGKGGQSGAPALGGHAGKGNNDRTVMISSDYVHRTLSSFRWSGRHWRKSWKGRAWRSRRLWQKRAQEIHSPQNGS